MLYFKFFFSSPVLILVNVQWFSFLVEVMGDPAGDASFNMRH